MNFGRVYAAYGGYFILLSDLWGVYVDSKVCLFSTSIPLTLPHHILPLHRRATKKAVCQIRAREKDPLRRNCLFRTFHPTQRSDPNRHYRRIRSWCSIGGMCWAARCRSLGPSSSPSGRDDASIASLWPQSSRRPLLWQRRQPFLKPKHPCRRRPASRLGRSPPRTAEPLFGSRLRRVASQGRRRRCAAAAGGPYRGWPSDGARGRPGSRGRAAARTRLCRWSGQTAASRAPLMMGESAARPLG